MKFFAQSYLYEVYVWSNLENEPTFWVAIFEEGYLALIKHLTVVSSLKGMANMSAKFPLRDKNEYIFLISMNNEVETVLSITTLCSIFMNFHS